MSDVTPLATVTNSYSYDYESGNGAPASGQALQHTTLSTFAINEIDHGGTNQATFLGTLNNSCWFILNGVTYNILTAAVATGVLTLTVSPPIVAGSYGVTTIKFVSPDSHTTVGGPISPPIIPTSTFPPGGGVGSIGDPVGVPTFPPPTPPPIGTVPAGPLVGPAVAPAPVPPSLAGVVQPQYKTGSATSPTAASWFPQFTTASAYTPFPNNPPTGTPIVFANIWTNPSHTTVSVTAATWATGQTTYTTASAHGIAVGAVVQITGCTPAAFNGTFVTVAGTTGSTLVVNATTSPGTFVSGGSLGSTASWTVVTPPSTPTTGQIILNGWGLPGPSGSGPGPPSYPNPPGAGLPHLASAPESTSVQSDGGLVFPGQPVLFAAVGRRKRVSAIQSGHAKSLK